MHRNGCLLIQLHIIIFALLNSFMDSFGSLSDDSLNINIYLALDCDIYDLKGGCLRVARVHMTYHHEYAVWIWILLINMKCDGKHMCASFSLGRKMLSATRTICHGTGVSAIWIHSLAIHGDSLDRYKYYGFFLSGILCFFRRHHIIGRFFSHRLGIGLVLFCSVPLVIKLNYYGWDRCVTVCICNTSS